MYSLWYIYKYCFFIIYGCRDKDKAIERKMLLSLRFTCLFFFYVAVHDCTSIWFCLTLQLLIRSKDVSMSACHSDIIFQYLYVATTNIPGILCILFLCTNHLYTSLTQTQHLPITKLTILSGENYLSTGLLCFDKISLWHMCKRSKWNSG